MNYTDGCDDCDDVVDIERKMLANLPGGPDLVALKLASLVVTQSQPWIRFADVDGGPASWPSPG